MIAPKSIILNMPEAIDTATSDAMKYHSFESRVAYLKLVSKEGEKHYKDNNEWNDKINQHLIGLINAEIMVTEEDLEKERENYKPLGFRFEEETIQIELDFYDTIEKQAEYLKKKIKEFDIDTNNVATNEYDESRNRLIILLRNKERSLGIVDKNEELEKLTDHKKLKSFERGKLQAELKIIAKKLNLKQGVSVTSKKVFHITNSLRNCIRAPAPWTGS